VKQGILQPRVRLSIAKNFIGAEGVALLRTECTLKQMVVHVGTQGSDAAFFSRAAHDNKSLDVEDSPSDGLDSSQFLIRRLQSLMGSKHIDLMSLLLKPAHTSSAIQGYIQRQSSGRWRGKAYFDYFMNLSKSKDMYCLSSRGCWTAEGAYYSIYADQEEGNQVAKLRSNRDGTKFSLYACEGEGATRTQVPCRPGHSCLQLPW
jgi:hypothetical protein